MSFDTERFIIEIEKHPAIWDSRLNSYSNKQEKIKAWEEICTSFNINFNEKTDKEKSEIALSLQKKWKCIKDCFNREKQKMKKISSGSEYKPKKQYVYYNILKFLLPLSDIRPTAYEETQIHQRIIEDDEEYRENLTQPRKKKKITSEEKLYDVLASNIINNAKREEQKASTICTELDPDKHFLLSLYNDFKHIKEDARLYAKLEILNVILKYKNSNTANSQLGYSSLGTDNSMPSTSRQHYSYTTNLDLDESTSDAAISSQHDQSNPTAEDDTLPGSNFEDSMSTQSESLLEDMFAKHIF